MISLDKGKLSYIKLIIGVVPPVCPCLTQFMPQIGAEMASSRGKEKKFPPSCLLRTEFTPEVALLIADFTLFPLAAVFLIAKIPPFPLGGALLIAEFTLFP
jgi:hypothetical protein